MNRYKDILRGILSSIDYSEDKEAFIDEFIGIIQARTALLLIKGMNPNKREELKKLLNKNTQTILGNYFTKEEIINSISKVSKELTSEYLLSVEHTLSQAQQDKISKTLNEIKTEKFYF